MASIPCWLTVDSIPFTYSFSKLLKTFWFLFYQHIILNNNLFLFINCNTPNHRNGGIRMLNNLARQGLLINNYLLLSEKLLSGVNLNANHGTYNKSEIMQMVRFVLDFLVWITVYDAMLKSAITKNVERSMKLYM